MVDRYAPIFEAAGREWNVDPRLLRAIAIQESGGDPTARSRAGAVGVMQIMPGTGQELGVTNLTDPEQSIYAGAKYLSQMLDRYKHPELALAAYNAGPGRVDAYLKGGALPDETLKYVPAVKAHFERSQPVGDRRASALPSDADFLKSLPSAGPDKPAPMSDADFLKALPGGDAPPAPPQQDRRQQGNPDDPVMPQRFQRRADLGPRSSSAVETGTTVGSMVDSARNIGAAAARGFQEGSQPLPPLVTPVMEGLGVFGPAGGGTLMQGVNRQIIAPVAQLGEWALRGANGLFRGAQAGVAQAGAEIDQPQLGRDLAAIPEAFMGGGMGMPRNRLAPGVHTEAPYARLAADLEARIAADRTPPAPPPPPPGMPVPDFLPPGVRAPEAPPVRPAAPPEFLPPGVAAEAGPRRSAGAAAATDQEANMSRKEAVAQRATAERQALQESQPAGVADNTEYVPGSVPTEAHIAQTTEAARAEKSMATQSPAAKQMFDDLRARNNEARADFFAEMEGSPTLKLRLEQAREQQAQADLRAAWRNKGAADATPVVKMAQSIIDGPAGRQESVEKTMKNVLARMQDKSGKPYTDPEMLYGVRNHIRNLLEGKTDDSAQASLARKELVQIRDALDGVIEQAAPGFRQYLENFKQASAPIDEMEILQAWSKKIRSDNGNGPITFQGVQRMMKDLVSARESTQPHAAHGISDETMAKLWALRNDLRRQHASETLARAPGSDSGQNFFDAAKGLATRAAAEGAAAAVGVPPGIPSMIWGTITGPMRENALLRGANRATSVDPNRLRPPPQ